MNNMELKGVRIASKFYSSVKLENPEDKTFDTIEYYNFEALLFSSFDADAVKKICEKINERKSLLIDFEKGTAFLIKDKIPVFQKEFYKTMSKSVVESFYEETGNMMDTNYMKTILGDYKDVEPIF